MRVGPERGSGREHFLEGEVSGEARLTRSHLGEPLSHHPLDDAEVSEIARPRNPVLGRYLPELNPVIGGVERLASLVIHELDDLIAHGVVIVGMFA